jgi:hypothetical protein
MKHLEAAVDRFDSIPDPYNCGRKCFKSKNNFFERYELSRIIEDSKFMFIADGIVYFSN